MIESERLLIIPLSLSQLDLWINDNPTLERELDCTNNAEELDEEFIGILREQLTIMQNDEANYLYHTFWLMIRRSDRVVVGSIDFKRPPNDMGEVEIGYGLGKDFEHNGYMTEAVQAMSDWAKVQAGVTSVIAETEPENFPSHRVLQRCGFTQYKQEDNLWWCLG